MFTHVQKILKEIESQSNTELGFVTQQLRALCLDDFAEVLLNLPNHQYPLLSHVMPKMASDETQDNWTGSHGYTLLRESLTFVRAIWLGFERTTGKQLSQATILDYGCGYGRLLRLMMYFSDNANLFGCDPWDVSIDLCKQAGINCDLKITDYLPLELPYKENSFDFIYAFSVFTHTSLRATQAALNALHPIVRPNGLLAITIRPIEYWDMDKNVPENEKTLLKDKHNTAGFAFRPHNRPPVDGDITYGDTSMSLEFLEHTFPNWSITGSERTIDAPYQQIVYLQSRTK